MILIDANLLIYAVNLNAPQHERGSRPMATPDGCVRRCASIEAVGTGDVRSTEEARFLGPAAR